MDRERYELVLGTVVLVFGIIILIVVLLFAFGLASSPGKFFEDQLPEEEVVEGPSASFSWTTDNYEVIFEDASRRGDADIVLWDWDFGDGNQSNLQNPTKVYPDERAYTVYLTVEDENGKSSSAFGLVEVDNNTALSGRSQPEFGGFESNIDFIRILLPLALAVLVVGLFFAMVVVGGYVTKAGWNLIKPKPETIKVRVKPKDLEIEPVHAPPAEQAPAYQTIHPPSQTGPPEVQPQEDPPPPP
ncbi:MAG: PKD domain-containing protein [Thermoplasmata archaeon]